MKYRWNPDWVVAPGETLRDWMDENHLPLKVAAHVCCMEPDAFERVLTGKRRISDVVAAKLSVGTGISASFWLAYEHNYRAGLAAGKIDASRGRAAADATPDGG